MALRPEILGLVQRPEHTSLIDQRTKELSLRNTGVALKSNELALQTQQKGAASQQAFEDAWRSSGGDLNKVEAALTAQGQGEAVMKIREHVARQTTEGLQADIAKINRAIALATEMNAPEKTRLEFAKLVAEREAQERIAANATAKGTQDAEVYNTTKGATGDLAEARQLYGPKMTPEQFIEFTGKKKAAGATPPTPRPLAEQTAEQWIKQNPGKTLVDYDRYQQDQRVRVARESRPDPAARPATGAQTTAMRYFLRMENALKEIAGVEEEIAKKGLAGQTIMEWFPNFLQTQEGQTYDVASKQFTEARLRKDSGAAIPPHEYVQDRKMYFAQPGDSPKTLEQKRVARNITLNGIKQEAGRAFNDYTGEEPSVSAPSGVGSSVDEAMRILSGQ